MENIKEPVSPRDRQNTVAPADEALELLKRLIATPSFSREEDRTATLLADFLAAKGVEVHRRGNNLWAFNAHFSDALPTILLNSHHDTVRPNKGYTRDPFSPDVTDGKLFGLGSNDAGGALVSLIATFLYFYGQPGLPFNLALAATAEEEISGTGGVSSILEELSPIAFGIVGEPTQMDMAIAEKGLMVLDCIAHGTGGHAAHGGGDNAIYRALPDIEWFRSFRFPQVSSLLGEVRMNVTQVSAGSQHNVIPDRCAFTVDVRTTDALSNAEVLRIIRSSVKSQVVPRSVRLNPSSIPADHPLVKAGILAGCRTYGSPTTSDQAVMNFPTVKIGPGDSTRSHSSDEFIFVDEIAGGIQQYIRILSILSNNGK